MVVEVSGNQHKEKDFLNEWRQSAAEGKEWNTSYFSDIVNASSEDTQGAEANWVTYGRMEMRLGSSEAKVAKEAEAAKTFASALGGEGTASS